VLIPPTSAVETNSQATPEPMRYLVAGDVTFRGVTRNYEDEMTFENSYDRTIAMRG